MPNRYQASSIIRFNQPKSFIYNNFNQLLFGLLISLSMSTIVIAQNGNYIIDEYFPEFIDESVLGRKPVGGDTIFISASRTRPLQFDKLVGAKNNPIVIINKGGQVNINATNSNDWGALVFFDAKHVKLSGAGHPGYKYGFVLEAKEAGISFSRLSSDCETEFIKISHDGFFGIVAKEDYHGNPPSPYPVFENLSIHDCFIEGVSEGLYLGETKSPGMEFKHVSIYNNIIRNTLRESIQIANMVEDVEIYNNTLINAGLEGLNFHKNILQVGDNSVANIYNNIMIGAPDYGVINFGKGNVHVHSNYIAQNKGMFSDNRLFSDAEAPMTITDNYFKSLVGVEVIKNLNQINFLTVSDNFYDVPMNFFNDGTSTNNESLNNNTLSPISEVYFTDVAANNYALTDETAIEFLGMGAPGGPEFFDYDDPATTSKKLIIRPEMVMDSVFAGSVDAPLFLFDEQHLDISSDEQPVSKSWKPAYNMNGGPYHAVIDLGSTYFISDIHLHDMHGINDFTVEYYDNDAWQTLVVESCDRFKVWKTHVAEIETRYLRFSMYDSPYAAINEVLIYGYPALIMSEQIVVNANMITDLTENGSIDSPYYLFDEQSVDYENDVHPTSKSWKPYYTNAKAPYHTVIDLGTEHQLTEIQLHDMNGTAEFIVQYGDGENWTDLIIEPLTSYKVWKKHRTDVRTRYLRLVMPDSPYANVNEIVLIGYELMSITPSQEQKIIVESQMLNDLVIGGSVDSPVYLFDEQDLEPFENDHAVSKNWKPFYNNTKAPYYVEIDLEQDYALTKIMLHDMHATNDFIIEYEADSNWMPLVVESCNAYRTWKTHQVDVVARKLRLVMLDSPYAGVNEMLLYGYPIENQEGTQRSISNKLNINDMKVDLSAIQLYPNPVKDKITLSGLSQSDWQAQVSIVDKFGNVLYNVQQSKITGNEVFEFEIGHVISRPDVYLLVYKTTAGSQKSIPFIKL